MKILTVRNLAAVVAAGTILACSPLDCDNDDSSSSVPPPEPVSIRGFWPCIGPAGSQVTIFRTPQAPVSFRFGLGFANVTNSTATSVVATVPADAITGPIAAVDSFLRTVGSSAEPFTVGTDDPVPEIEPNEDINGADATPMGPRTRGTGQLSGTADRDHFRRGCFITGARYSVMVSPRVTDTVFVNGLSVPLDGAGRGEFIATANSLLFGMTNGDGAYTMTIGFVAP